MKFFEYSITLLFGSLAYGCIEYLYRGWVHWSMFICGGICFTLVYIISNSMRDSLWKKWILSAVVITTVEYFVGILLNIWLQWNVWDYSHYKIQLMGQICLTFSIYWFLLMIPVVPFCKLLKKKLINPLLQVSHR